jgi:CDP-glycerol glycerophosphotransferase
VLVTDYSSVFFDYANLNRPIIFYMYDFETYANNMRGFYVDVEELPGPIVYTDEELLQALKSTDENIPSTYIDRYRRFSERFNYLDDGRAGQRVIGRVTEQIPDTGL